jgi:hypothetical protein
MISKLEINWESWNAILLWWLFSVNSVIKYLGFSRFSYKYVYFWQYITRKLIAKISDNLHNIIIQNLVTK